MIDSRNVDVSRVRRLKMLRFLNKMAKKVSETDNWFLQFRIFAETLRQPVLGSPRRSVTPPLGPLSRGAVRGVYTTLLWAPQTGWLRRQGKNGLLVVVNDGVHHVHHGFGGKEHRFDGVKPVFALIEIIRHLMPTAVVLLAEVVEIFPIAREA